MIAPILPAITAGIAVLIAALLWVMPQLTRPDLYFAVTVPSTFRNAPEALSILRHYRTELALVSAAALAAIASSLFWEKTLFVPAILYVQVGASFFVFYRARRHVLPHAVAPTTVREVELHAQRAVVPGGLWLALGPYLILGAAALYLRLHRQMVPARFPVHWGLFPVLTAVITLVTLSVILYGLAHWFRAVYSGGALGRSELRFRRSVAVLLLVFQYYIALQLSWIALSPLRAKSGFPEQLVTRVVPPVIAAIGIALLALQGQGGSKAAPAGASPVGDRTADRFWKLGVLYVNPDDPAVFVERRFGLGYTLNFGRPATWFIIAFSLGGVAALALLTLIARHSR